MKVALATSLCFLSLVGCKSKPEVAPAGSGPAVSAERTGPTENPAANPGPPSGTEPGAPAPSTGALVQPGAAVITAPIAAVEAPVAPGAESVPVPELPKAPEDNVLLVARRAATICPDDPKAACPERAQLAAKIPIELDQVIQLLAEGTDQEKRALRAALLLVRDEKVDEVTASQLLGATGEVDRNVLHHLAGIRSAAAIPVLLARLPKTGGDEAVAIIEAIGHIGGAPAREALAKLMTDKAMAPYWGEVCRAASRSMAKAMFEGVVATGNSIAATPRQADGCRNAEAAFRMLGSAGDLVVNIGGLQRQAGRVLVWQKPSRPWHIELTIPTDPGATCDTPGTVHATFEVPLDRTGKPILGEGVGATLATGTRPQSADGVYLMTLDALELREGAEIRGHVAAVHQKSKTEEHLVISGPISGTYCGVR